MSDTAYIERRIEREIKARKAAEEILEEKALELHKKNQELKELEEDLRKARDEAERAQRAEKEFLAQMSHEIRTPLNAVIGMANLLSTTELNEEQAGYVQDVKYAADVLHGLISDVLDLSKIEAGQVELSESLIDIHQSVAMMSRALEYRAKDKGNSLSFSIHPDVPKIIKADRTIINQILLNLVGNSIKFSSNAAIHIGLSARPLDEGKCELNFEIQDEGIGIAANKIDTIFEKFKQAEGRQTHKEYGGTGLGLPICKQLIELHGGTIDVESTPGKGSRFYFNIVVNPAEEEFLESEIHEAGGQGILDLEKLHFLIVEDTFLNQKYVCGLLKRWGSKWTIAENGKEGVEASSKEPFDIILMDIQMPVMDGYESTALIRNDSNNPNRDVPTVALTASAFLDEKNKALNAGMNDHLTKPFTPDQMMSLLQRLLGRNEEE